MLILGLLDSFHNQQLYKCKALIENVTNRISPPEINIYSN